MLLNQNSTPVFSKFQIGGRFQRFRAERTGVMFSQINCFSTLSLIHFSAPLHGWLKTLKTLSVLHLNCICTFCGATDKRPLLFSAVWSSNIRDFLKKRASSQINAMHTGHSFFKVSIKFDILESMLVYVCWKTFVTKDCLWSYLCRWNLFF